MNLDLKNFHKIETSEHATTLEHPKGHQIKVAHKGLSKELKAQLEELPMKMAKGGKVHQYNPNVKGSPGTAYAQKAAGASKASGISDSQETPQFRIPKNAFQPAKASEAYTEPQDAGTQPFQDVVIQALHSELPPYGPLKAEKPHYPPCINPSCKSYGHSHPNCRCYGGNPEGKPSGEMKHMFAEGGEVESYCSKDRPHQEGCEYFKDGGDVQESKDNSDIVPEEPNNENPVPQTAVPPESPEPATTPEPQAETQMAAQPQAAVNMNPEQPQAQPTSVSPAAEHAQQVHNLLTSEDKATSADVASGSIHPKTYNDLLWKDKSALGKIGTLFGLLIGGAGAGLAGQKSAIMEMMDQTIQRDLDAQQKSVENKNNILKINQDNLANNATVGLTRAQAGQIAIPLAYMQKNRAALDSLVQITNKMPEGPQKLAAQQQLGILSTMVEQKNMSIAAQAGMASALQQQMGGGEGQPNTMLMKSGMLGPNMKEMGGDIEQKSIPGIPGRANRPIEKSDRDQILAMKVLSDKANDLMTFAAKHRGTLSPSNRKVAAQKAEEMVNFYNNSIQGGVLTQGRMKWLDDQISKNPTGVVTQLMGNQARLKEIKDSNDHRRNLLLNSYGMGEKSTPQQQSSEVKTMNGVQYTKVAGGWKKVK